MSLTVVALQNAHITITPAPSGAAARILSLYSLISVGRPRGPHLHLLDPLEMLVVAELVGGIAPPRPTLEVNRIFHGVGEVSGISRAQAGDPLHCITQVVLHHRRASVGGSDGGSRPSGRVLVGFASFATMSQLACVSNAGAGFRRHEL